MTAPEAFDRLFEHRTWVRGLVRSLVLDPLRADDVEQQVWLSALESAPSRLEKPRAWLAAVARNWARIDHRGVSRRRRREAVVARREASEVEGDPVERAEAHRAVVEAVLGLPEPQRTAVLLHHFDGLSVADTARRLGAPHETVRSRLRLARERLRERLAPHGADTARAWSPALLALAGVPRDFALPSSVALSGGTIAMAAGNKVALALILPLAAGVAWFTAHAAAPPPPDTAVEEAVEKLAARLDRLERTAEAPRPVRPTEDRPLLQRLDALEQRIAAIQAAPVRGSAPTRGPNSADAPGSGPADEAERNRMRARDEDAARADMAKAMSDKADADAFQKEYGDALARATPGSPEHRAAMRRIEEFCVANAGPPPSRQVGHAERLLDSEARRNRVSPDEAAEAATMMETLAVGNAARPALAKAVAGGWASDRRLGEFLPRLAANTDPAVHKSLLVILDHSPSPAFSEYVLRLVREEREPTVLGSALNDDRLNAAATQELAPQFIQAVEGRLLDGSLTGNARANAGRGLASIGRISPAAAAAALRRVAASESDPKLAETLRAAAERLAR